MRIEHRAEYADISSVDSIYFNVGPTVLYEKTPLACESRTDIERLPHVQGVDEGELDPGSQGKHQFHFVFMLFFVERQGYYSFVKYQREKAQCKTQCKFRQ